MDIKKEIKQSQSFEHRYEELLYLFNKSTGRLLRMVKFHYLKLYIQLKKEFSPDFVKSEIQLRINRGWKYIRHKEPVGILVDSLDKGGLEQVVYNLCKGFKKVKPYIFITGEEYGDMGWKLRQEGFYVYILEDDFKRFSSLVQQIGIKKINSHYSIWNFKKIHHKEIQIFYTIHNSYTWIEGENLNIRKEAYKKVTKFIAVSSSVKKYFCKKFNVPSKKINIIPNGFDLERWVNLKDKKYKGKKHRGRVFVNVASFAPLKNQILLVSAFAEVNKKYPDTILYLVGNVLDVDYYNRVVSLIEKLGLTKKIKIMDFMTQEKLFDVYKKTDCFVLSSLQEGAPNVLLESMYMGLPTISTDVGNARELLADYGIVIKNSYNDLTELNINDLVAIAHNSEQSNTKDLVQAMEHILEDINIFKEKGKDSSDYIQRFFQKKIQVDEYEKLILSEK